MMRTKGCRALIAVALAAGFLVLAPAAAQAKAFRQPYRPLGPADLAPPLGAEMLAPPLGAEMLAPPVGLAPLAPHCCPPACPPTKTVVLKVQNPRCCTDCRCVEVCIPACCEGPPKICSRCGILGRGVVTYEWCCGHTVKVVFTATGDVRVR